MTIYETLIQVLRNLGGKGYYADIYKEYERISGVHLTAGQKAGIRKCIENCSSDSANFKGKEDAFLRSDLQKLKCEIIII